MNQTREMTIEELIDEAIRYSWMAGAAPNANERMNHEQMAQQMKKLVLMRLR